MLAVIQLVEGGREGRAMAPRPQVRMGVVDARGYSNAITPAWPF